MPDPVSPSIWLHAVATPALVLGSTQPPEVVDQASAEAAGIEVCRRRSGGGLVGLRPDNDLWIDVLIPRSSGLWHDDVGKAFEWLGATWAAALGETLVNSPTIEVHRGPLIDREAGRLLCFAGLGPGEVTVGDRKVVGLSQRRTRLGARFQCAMTWNWDPAWIEAYINPTLVTDAGIALDDLRIGLPHPDVAAANASPSLPSPAAVTDAFLRHLPCP